MSPDPTRFDNVRRAGIKPGDLLIEQASKSTLVVNQKTAKELDIVVPS